MKKALGIAGDRIDAIAKIFQLHPHFHPRRYVDFRVELTGPQTARLSLGDCPALGKYLERLLARPRCALTRD